MGLAERIESWEKEFIENGRQEGEQKGRREGESLILQRLLTKRFGPLSADKVATIATASTEQLEVWLDRILDAETLDGVFQ